MSQSYWAISTWQFLHTISIQLNNNLFERDKQIILNICYNICTNLPCPTCSEHARHALNSNNYWRISNLEQLRQFMFNFHNTVNKHTGKKIEDVTILDKYKHYKISVVVNNFIRYYPKSYDTGLKLSISGQITRKKIVKDLLSWLKSALR
tara:strand:- start:206 stop:655 length:450 start_codon:yes stop_codon:yes gene_type:complete